MTYDTNIYKWGCLKIGYSIPSHGYSSFSPFVEWTEIFGYPDFETVLELWWMTLDAEWSNIRKDAVEVPGDKSIAMTSQGFNHSARDFDWQEYMSTARPLEWESQLLSLDPIPSLHDLRRWQSMWSESVKKATKKSRVFLEMRDPRTPEPDLSLQKRNALRVFELFFGLLLDTLQPKKSLVSYDIDRQMRVPSMQLRSFGWICFYGLIGFQPTWDMGVLKPWYFRRQANNN